ncbi:BCL-6 corepressor-like protein 1 isoform X2 [Megalops cyprinoides]|uniref:BCL-6 corepressor-like protein 1 isoform X2 n=1 Tax=Megalops cyprinoides TaxID=118141 RepID=UPI001863DF9F|nr:BCL-6 corepressor-like protein 1 isoform X2 [Megalops cyprinoides]
MHFSIYPLSKRVDATPMNAGDGGPVITETGAPNKASASMVGNPPQTLPPELRGDVPLSQQTDPATAADCKIADASSEVSSCPEVPPSPQSNSTPSLSPAPVNTAAREKAEIPKSGADHAVVFSMRQWAGGKKVPLKASPSDVNANKRSSAQTQPVISLPSGFQGSSLFKPGQQVAFIPSNFTSPLCTITLPPGLGQIAALREATANQFRADCRPQSSSASTVPQLQAYPYHFSVGRALTPETRPASAAPKTKQGPVSDSKSLKAAAEHGSALDSVAAPTTAPRFKQPASGSAPQAPLSVFPSAPICCSPTLPSVSTHSRLLNHLEKGPSHRSADKTSITYARLKAPCVTQEHVLAEARDMPLDLSSKSKRPKTTKDPQTPSQANEHNPPEAGQNETVSQKKAVTASFGPDVHQAIFPDPLRNGAPPKQATQLLNHQVLEPSVPWPKSGPQGSINNLTGTYVGVASPILASTLRSKDGKGAAFVEDLQNTAKPETISIIDQGEQLVSRGKKEPSVTKDAQHIMGSMYSNNACLHGTKVCTSKDTFPTAEPIPAGSHPHRKLSSGRAAVPLSPAVDSPSQHQPVLPHQGSMVQRKVIQVTPKLRVFTGCEGPLLQSAHPSSPKIPEKKWGKTKSPLSNLESIVKQKALETSTLSVKGCNSPAAAGPRRPDALSLHFGSQDTQPRQVDTSEFLPFRSVKRRDGNPEADSSEGAPAKVTCNQENRSIAELREKTTEKCLKREEKTGSDEHSDSSRLHTQIFVGCGPADKNRIETSSVQKAGEEREKPVFEGLPPCVKLEEIALSILKGQCADVAELRKESHVTKEGSPSKAEAAVSINKKVSPSRLEKASPASTRKMVTSLKRSHDKDRTTEWHQSKKKKQWVPAPESRQQDAATSQLGKETEETTRGWTGLDDVLQLSYNKTGNESISITPSKGTTEAPGSQSSPGWLSKELQSSGGRPPRLRRGRRRTDEARQEGWSPPAASPPVTSPPATSPPATSPPAPQPQIRRPRGRPRSTPLPDQPRSGTPKPANGSEGDASVKKRKRRRNSKYQNGEYVTERDRAGEGDETCVTTRQATRAGTDQRMGLYPRTSPTVAYRSTSPDTSPRKGLLTRSGSARHPECHASPEPADKPSGKRKFKSKHLCSTDEEKKLKTKRGSSGRRSSSLIADADSPLAKKSPPRGLSSPTASKTGGARRGRTPESPPGRPVPPEVRRLIVNKNAGETLLQRAARLGYQEVVLYCLEKDVREVNRRDNAGYTALHEACARGWTHIVQMLLEHGADINCSSQDGTRPIHDAVAGDNLPVAWMLLNRGADPTLATYSGQTAVKLAQSPNMKIFLSEYFADLDGRADNDPGLQWDFYSSSVFETEQDACWDFLLSCPEEEKEERKEMNAEKDCFLFEFSTEPLLPCYYVQVSLSQGFCNWFLLSDVLKRLKMSARIFRARYPHFEVVSISWSELCRQVSISQVTPVPRDPQVGGGAEADGPVELVRCVSDLQGLLGSSVELLEEEPLDTDYPSAR